MAELLAAGYLSDLQRTQQEMRDGFEQLRNFIAQLPGAAGIETLVISEGVVEPTQAWHRVDTEGSSSLDTLDRIGQNNLPTGSILILEAVDPGRRVIVSHLAGGLGEIRLVAGTDISLNSRSKLMLVRNGTVWEQMFETRIAEGATATIDDYAADVAPVGSVMCFGQTISWEENPELASKIGTRFGGVNGVTIGIPDLRDRVTIGRSNMGGVDANRIANTYGNTAGVGNTLGTDAVTLTTSNLPSFSLSAGTLTGQNHAHASGSLVAANHTHSYTSAAGQNEVSGAGATARDRVNATTGGSGTLSVSGNTGNSGSLNISGSTGSIGSNVAFGIIQPSMVMNKIMWL